MFRRQTLTGVFLGLILGLAILALIGSPQKRLVPSGAVLSESDGHLRRLVVQYEPSARDISGPVYHEFLGALDTDIAVYVLCPDKAAFADFTTVVGSVKCKITPIFAHHAMTTWSRDRWVSLAPPSPGEPTTVLSPLGEAGEEVWPARAGDLEVGVDISRALAPSVFARRSRLYFDGGDFLADSENVFVVPRMLPRNLQRTVPTVEELLKELASELKRKPILIEASPDHHAGMFMASVGSKTMLVADPSLAKPLLPPEALQSAGDATNTFMNLPGGPDFTEQTQALFDAVASQCASNGYKVVRIPVVPAHDSRTYLTYVNVLLDYQGSRRIVYLPYYRNVEALNAAARKVWEGLGYEIRPVDCTSAYRHFGCLHCLVNVIERN
jgi:hypothetical protein